MFLQRRLKPENDSFGCVIGAPCCESKRIGDELLSRETNRISIPATSSYASSFGAPIGLLEAPSKNISKHLSGAINLTSSLGRSVTSGKSSRIGCTARKLTRVCPFIVFCMMFSMSHYWSRTVHFINHLLRVGWLRIYLKGFAFEINLGR